MAARAPAPSPARLALLVGGTLVLVAAGGLVARRSGLAVRQPIAFNHAKHVARKLPCTFCHRTVEKEAFATLPPLKTCMMCHTKPQTESLEEEKIRAFARAGEEIPWRRVYELAPDVFFPHRRHVAVAGIGCETCHGDMAAAEMPPGKPFVQPTMAWCMECHEARGTSADCNTCHR